MSLISSLFSRKSPRRGFKGEPVSPDAPFFAVGDVHGCAALLERLFEKIDAIAPDQHVVTVGDYVDRGEASKRVLDFLQERADRAGGLTCLAGNHEEMMLSFIDVPDKRGNRWLRYGGLQTLASYGITGATETTDGEALIPIRDAFVAAMGETTLAWLRDLPRHYQSGNVGVVHAGADPLKPLEGQIHKVLTWGVPEFTKVPRPDGVWIIHGHTIVDAPTETAGRIAIDTGAYATGRLTAAHVVEGGCEYILA